MGQCGRCKIETEGLKDGNVCADCLSQFKISDKGRDFVRWLTEKHPEVAEKAMMNNVSDEDAPQ